MTKAFRFININVTEGKMYNEINEKMATLKKGMARLKQINITLLMIKADLQILKQKENDLKVILEYENYDVESLENRSLTSFFYSKLGTLDKHLEKERAEALTVKLQYEHAVREIGDVENQISGLEADRLLYKDCQTEYDTLFQQKKEVLLKDNGAAGQKISALTEQIRLSRNRAKESSDAAASGNNIIAILNDALDCIIKAEICGERDRISNISSGFDLFDDLDKHSFLDQAKTAIDIAKVALSRFRTELVKIVITVEPEINTDGFAKFADFFLDGWSNDHYMQERMNHARQSVHDAKYQVTVIVGILKDIEMSEQENVNKLEADINSIIAAA
jgi:hypothetical protein